MMADALLTKEFEFEIKLRIKDESGKIVELGGKESVKINWEEGKKISRRSQKEVIFKRDGKDYPIILRLVLEDLGWWSVGVRSYGFSFPPNASYQIYHDSNPGVEPKKEEEDYWLFRKVFREEKVAEYVRLVDQQKKDRKDGIILFSALAGVLVVFFFILFLISKKVWRKIFFALSLLLILSFVFLLLLGINIGDFFN